MVAQEAKVEKAKEAVAVQRQEARANLVRRQGYRALGSGGQGRRSRSW